MLRQSILIVDDDELTREILSSILIEEGFQTEEAENGSRAYDLLEVNDCFDLIVCDINMPEMDGIELIRRVRGGLHLDTPIIVLSGNDQVAVAIEAIDEGASAYLIKDENIDQTVTVSVRQALEKKRIIDENKELVEDIKTKNQELLGIVETMTDIGLSLSSHDNLEDLFPVVVDCGMKLTNARGGILFLAEKGGFSVKSSRQEDGLSTIDDSLLEPYEANLSNSVMSVPLKSMEGDTIALLRLFSPCPSDRSEREGKFDECHKRYVESLASQAALIIENVRLHEENLRAARLSAIGEGIAGAAHCVKNILSGFDGGRYIMDVGLKRGRMKKVEQGWEMLKRNSDILKQLVLDMLDYSKDRSPDLQPVDVNSTCRDIVALKQKEAQAKNGEIQVELQEELETFMLDGKALYRALLNLVGNAVDALPERDGIVELTSTYDRDSRELVISVRDNGIGIPPDSQDKVFKPFFSTKGPKEGTGLGLAVSKKIISEHHGELSLSSKSGEGTVFTIKLPDMGKK